MYFTLQVRDGLTSAGKRGTMSNEKKVTIDQSTARKMLQEMNLIDDFLFTSMMSYPEICERFSQLLVKVILNYDVENVRVTPQKVFYGSNTNTHGTRLDVYIEEDTSEFNISEEYSVISSSIQPPPVL